MTIQKKDILPVTVLLSVFGLAIFMVNPAGDFPLNDDFSYGRSVYNLVEKGSLQFDQWLSMTLLTQVLWGTGFCKTFGFSFTVLRFSTLVLGYFGVAAAYFLFRDFGQNRKVALFLALLILFNPFFFSLSFTFMTDVPFFSFLMLSTLFFSKALKQGALKWIIAGAFFGIAATFVRQLGLMLPMAFGVVWLMKEGIRPKPVLQAGLPLAITLALFYGWTFWLDATQSLPDGYGTFGRVFNRTGKEGHFLEGYKRMGILLFYFGLFLLPLTAMLKFPFFKKLTTSQKWWMAAILLLACGFFCFAWSRMPWGNILHNIGLGPKLLKDSQYGLNVYPVLSNENREIFRIISALAAVLFLLHFVPALFNNFRKSHPYRWPVIFSVTNLMLYGGFLMLDAHFFDRYYFIMLPFVFICFLPGQELVFNKKLVVAGGMFLLVHAAFSVTATHDYLSWNRARWKALGHLTEVRGISPHLIDGGFEFNGWHKPGERDYASGKSWWWVDKDDFVVSFGDIEGYKKVEGYPFLRWLPPGVDSVYILKRN